MAGHAATGAFTLNQYLLYLQGLGNGPETPMQPTQSQNPTAPGAPRAARRNPLGVQNINPNLNTQPLQPKKLNFQ